jgi:nitrogen-specific signal transduction histidine kinase/CheY-like chemotaxis protein
MARDISERIRGEAEQRKLESQLQQAQKMEAIGTLASGIAHDFNNIMMGILGNASLMLAKIESDHPHHLKLKNIEKYIESGSELTKQLLGFARGGKTMVRPIRIGMLVASSARMFGRTRKELRIHTDHLNDSWPVEVDRGQIEQVLLNLLVNAWQAMPDGGDIFLSSADTELSRDGRFPFEVQPGRYVQVAISDTGVGMDTETQKRIFQPFFTTKEMGRGTGLGLASAYGIIKNHGGYITVTSEPGKGATFEMFLPASDKHPVEVNGDPQPAQKEAGMVLLVDDEQITLEVGEEILRELGYSVLTARGGREAIDLFRSHRRDIDLVVLDMIMPDMAGGKTFDALREIDPDVKVLLASGYSISGEAAEILQRGCNDFIQKPFNMTQLDGKIRKILSPLALSEDAAATGSAAD